MTLGEAALLLRVRDAKRVFEAREFEGAPPLGGQKHTFLVLDGNRTLWVRQVATGSDVQILPPQKISPTGLTFTPDGSYLYYRSADPDRDGYTAVFEVPALGGTPRKRGPLAVLPLYQDEADRNQDHGCAKPGQPEPARAAAAERSLHKAGGGHARSPLASTTNWLSRSVSGANLMIAANTSSGQCQR